IAFPAKRRRAGLGQPDRDARAQPGGMAPLLPRNRRRCHRPQASGTATTVDPAQRSIHPAYEPRTADPSDVPAGFPRFIEDAAGTPGRSFAGTISRNGDSSCGELLQLVNSVLDALTITEQMIPPQ